MSIDLLDEDRPLTRSMRLTRHSNVRSAKSMGRKHSKTTGEQRRAAFEETERVAREAVEEERRKRQQKTERLRQARLQAKAPERPNVGDQLNQLTGSPALGDGKPK
ncbi:hypothetical protein LPU83_pLPU83d_0995 (plasmid) [Rhizobium favelukesii]|uniref:Uncharacterized protein n=2 Tax=Rhizobium/Agrobacterium group TaxID=227290 RepID=W6RQB3_9HYPH|nr:hypothetical protein LPU83_pLPU83d_0995 [Rhizobium favelukesii]